MTEEERADYRADYGKRMANYLVDWGKINRLTDELERMENPPESEESKKCIENIMERYWRYHVLFGYTGLLAPAAVEHAVQDDGLWRVWKELDLETAYKRAVVEIDREIYRDEEETREEFE